MKDGSAAAYAYFLFIILMIVFGLAHKKTQGDIADLRLEIEQIEATCAPADPLFDAAAVESAR